MRPLFIDTGYLLALELAHDQNHSMAKQHWQSLLDALPPLITTSYVFDETVTFFNSRGDHEVSYSARRQHRRRCDRD